MFRVIHSDELSPKEKGLFQVLGRVALYQPEALGTLLKAYGKEVEESQLVGEVIELLGDSNFDHSLARLIARQIEFELSNFNWSEVKEAAKDTNVTVGADPVSAIAGAIGSAFSFAGSLSQRKERKAAARKEALQSMMAYRSQMGKQQANQPLATQPQRKASLVSLMLLIGLLAAGMIYWRVKTTKTQVI